MRRVTRLLISVLLLPLPAMAAPMPGDIVDFSVFDFGIAGTVQDTDTNGVINSIDSVVSGAVFVDDDPLTRGIWEFDPTKISLQPGMFIGSAALSFRVVSNTTVVPEAGILGALIKTHHG